MIWEPLGAVFFWFSSLRWTNKSLVLRGFSQQFFYFREGSQFSRIMVSKRFFLEAGRCFFVSCSNFVCLVGYCQHRWMFRSDPTKPTGHWSSRLGLPRWSFESWVFKPLKLLPIAAVFFLLLFRSYPRTSHQQEYTRVMWQVPFFGVFLPTPEASQRAIIWSQLRNPMPFFVFE